MKKFGVLVAILMLPLVMATNFEISINDEQGDVGNPDIDIVKVWTTEEGGNVVFSMEVVGQINSAYAHTFTASSDGKSVMAGYSNGHAYYSSGTSFGKPEYSIDGNKLQIYIPSTIFSGWQDFKLSATASDHVETDFLYSRWDSGDESEKSTDPTKEKPTDISISVKITKVEYEFKKVDGGTKWYAKILIEGTTNGVDHVSLNFVTYYKNGSYDWGEWLRGPLEMKPGSFFGTEIIKFVFNSTEGNWNKWKFEMEGKYPVTEAEYKWAEKSDEVDKFAIYARAFKDAAETKWNQAKYETKPTFTTEGAKYGGTEEKKGTPGFEF